MNVPVYCYKCEKKIGYKSVNIPAMLPENKLKMIGLYCNECEE